MKHRKMPRNNSTGQIRIIAGKWRGRKLPVADSPGLRPTTDRTKETLFNWLMPYTDSETRCLDLFAGSGGLGLEALSRHAKQVVLVEKNKSIVKKLKKIANILQVTEQQLRVAEGSAAEFISHCEEQFDLVFIDPPFNHGMVSETVDALVCRRLLSKNAIIYIEHEYELTWNPPSEFIELKSKSTKQVCFRLFQFQPT